MLFRKSSGITQLLILNNFSVLVICLSFNIRDFTLKPVQICVIKKLTFHCISECIHEKSCTRQSLYKLSSIKYTIWYIAFGLHVTFPPGLFVWNAVVVKSCTILEGLNTAAAADPVRAVKSFDTGADFVSEVGLLAGNGPERDLFVVLEGEVVSAERPVKDSVTVNLKPRQFGRKKRDHRLVFVAYLSLCSRGVRRIWRTRNLNLRLKISFVENLSDILIGDWMYWSNWANSLVSVNLLNCVAVLIWTTKTDEWESAVADEGQRLSDE